MAYLHIEVDDVRRRAFRVAISPLPSLYWALRDAAGAGRGRTPEAWCKAIRRHLRASDYETLVPFVTPHPTQCPDSLLGLTDAPGDSLKDGVERIMAAPVEWLVEEIEICSSFSSNGTWRQAERDPARWRRRYVGSLLRAWKGFGPVWHQARVALTRELERVAMATALDAQVELLDGLLDNGAVEDGRWCFRWGPDECCERRVVLPEHGLVLLPMLAGERASIVAGGHADLRHVAYPVSSALALEPCEFVAPPLEALLGIPRSQILRAVGCPTSIGLLAHGLPAAPSVATHHVDALEAAGLVARVRSGRNVLVRRTTRGEVLLNLYDEAASETSARGRTRRAHGADRLARAHRLAS